MYARRAKKKKSENEEITCGSIEGRTLLGTRAGNFSLSEKITKRVRRKNIIKNEKKPYHNTSLVERENIVQCRAGEGTN